MPDIKTQCNQKCLRIELMPLINDKMYAKVFVDKTLASDILK